MTARLSVPPRWWVGSIGVLVGVVLAYLTGVPGFWRNPAVFAGAVFVIPAITGYAFRVAILRRTPSNRWGSIGTVLGWAVFLFAVSAIPSGFSLLFVRLAAPGPIDPLDVTMIWIPSFVAAFSFIRFAEWSMERLA
jgi:hypothetical protein